MFADIEDVVVARIGDLFAPASCRAGDMPNRPIYPYCQVSRVAGGDDIITDYPSVDLDFFDLTDNYPSLAVLARLVHFERMFRWNNKVTVVLPVTGERIRIEDCFTAQAPIKQDYDDAALVRMWARYRIRNRAQTAA